MDSDNNALAAALRAWREVPEANKVNVAVYLRTRARYLADLRNSVGERVYGDDLPAAYRALLALAEAAGKEGT